MAWNGRVQGFRAVRASALFSEKPARNDWITIKTEHFRSFGEADASPVTNYEHPTGLGCQTRLRSCHLLQSRPKPSGRAQ